MLTRLFKAFSTRNGKHRLPTSPKVRLLLQPLESRLVPTGTSLSAGTLTITETSSGAADTVQEIGFNQYTVIDSTTTINYSNVSNIVFNAATTNVSLTLLSPTGNYSTSGNLSVIGAGSFNALSVAFQTGVEINGNVTITDTGVGSSVEVVTDSNIFGSLTVTGGSAVNAANTFVTLPNGLTGTYVDLEATQINGNVNVNFGAGGGYFLTDSSPGGGASGSANDAIHGNLAVTDLQTRFSDTFELYDTNVSGNVSIIVTAVAASEGTLSSPDAITPAVTGGINVQNFSIGNSLTINVRVSANNSEAVVVDNTSVNGSVSINESGAVSEAYAEFNDSSVRGSLTIWQPTGNVDLVNAFGGDNGPNNSIGGAATITQGAAQGDAFIDSFTSVKGNVSITQTGGYEHVAAINNSSVGNGLTSIAVLQTAAKYNTLYIDNDTLAGAGNLSITQSTATKVGSIDVTNDSISSSVLINQAAPGCGSNSSVVVEDDNIHGGVSLTQGGGVINSVYFDNSSTTGGISITQSGAGTDKNTIDINGSTIKGNAIINEKSGNSLDYVDIYANTSIQGNLSVTEGSTGNASFFVLENASVNGSISVNQATASQNYVQIQFDVLRGAATVNQVGSYQNYVYVDQDALRSVTINQSASVQFQYIEIDNDSSINGSISIYQNPGSLGGVSDIEFDQINGSITVNEPPQVAGGNTSTTIGNDLILGGVGINQAAGQVYFNNSSIGGAVSVNQSAGATPSSVLVNTSTFNSSVTITQQTGRASSDNVDFDGENAIKGNLTIKQGSTQANDVYFNASTVSGSVSIGQGSGYDQVNINTSMVGGNLVITGTSTLESNVSIGNNSSINMNTSIAESGPANAVTIDSNSQLIGSLTINLSAGTNLVDIFDATLFGTTTINLGASSTGDNVVEFGSDPFAFGGGATTFDGAVTVNMGDGVNTVDIGQTETVTFKINASVSGNISGYNTYNESNVSGSGTVNYKGF
jgi:hypothetical protein